MKNLIYTALTWIISFQFVVKHLDKCSRFMW